MFCYMKTPEGTEELSAVHHLINIECDPETHMPRAVTYRPRWAQEEGLPWAEFAFSHYGFTADSMMAMFFAPTAQTRTHYCALSGVELMLLPDLMPAAPTTIQ